MIRKAAYISILIAFMRRLLRKITVSAYKRMKAKEPPAWRLVFCFCKEERDYRYVAVGTAGEFSKVPPVGTRMLIMRKAEDTLERSGYCPMNYECGGYLFTGLGCIDSDVELVNGIEDSPEFICPAHLKNMRVITGVAVKEAVREARS